MSLVLKCAQRQTLTHEAEKIDVAVSTQEGALASRDFHLLGISGIACFNALKLATPPEGSDQPSWRLGAYD